ncbi:hypothetical protein [Ferroplasma sp.]|nr:hypothetical protein [Ferroplasma sp.]
MTYFNPFREFLMAEINSGDAKPVLFLTPERRTSRSIIVGPTCISNFLSI